MFIKSSAHFLIKCFWVLQFGFAIQLCEFFIFIFNMNPLLYIWCAYISSRFTGCLFIMLVVFFAVKKLFSLRWPNLFIFPFTAFAVGFKPPKIIAKTKVK